MALLSSLRLATMESRICHNLGLYTICSYNAILMGTAPSLPCLARKSELRCPLLPSSWRLYVSRTVNDPYTSCRNSVWPLGTSTTMSPFNLYHPNLRCAGGGAIDQDNGWSRDSFELCGTIDRVSCVTRHPSDSADILISSMSATCWHR